MRTANVSSIVEVLGALEGTGTGAWVWDVAPNVVRWSKNSGPLYGLPRGHQPASYEDFLTLIHDDDQDLMAKSVDAALNAAEDYEIDFRVIWPDGTLHWLSARAHAITDDDGVTVRIVGVVSDATDRKRTAAETAFLAKAGEVLGASLHVEETLAQVAELLADELADWCAISMVEDGRIHTAAVRHRDPAKMELALSLQRDYPPDPEPAGVAKQVIDSGEAVLISEIEDDMLVEAAVDERHLEILRSLGFVSAIVAPLKARGEILALVTLISADSRHRFTPRDMAFARQFADRAALAVDNARLHQESVRARLRAERSIAQVQAMHSVVSRLSTAADVQSVAAAAVEEGAAALGAQRGSVVLLAESEPSIVASVGYPQDRLEAFRAAIKEPGPLADALFSSSHVFCSSIAELIRRYPNLRKVVDTSQEAAFVAVPLQSMDGVVGAIGFVYEGARSFGPGERALASALAQHLTLAIDRSMLFERNRSVAESLSAALAPPPVVGDGQIPAAAHYRAAGVGAIGGDWYDVVSTPRGSQVYIIGDVVGRGLAAVAAMAQLRHSLRMLFLEGHDPASALATLTAATAVDTSALCSTVLCAEVRADSDVVDLASAGHLPPVLVDRDGAHLVDLPPGPPLGVGGGPSPRSITLGRDQCLAMFTDGVVERRDRPLDDSLRDLCDVLATTPPAVDAIARVLVEQSSDAEDDATILVVGGSRRCAGTEATSSDR